MAAFQFTYGITRRYPYWWFPWVAAIGGLIFGLLVSVFSLATSGYYLK